MTGPAVNQDVQYDAYGNPIKAKPPNPAKPALTLATGNQTAGNTTAYANVIPQAPEGAGNLLGKTIQPGPAVDRVGLAQTAWDKSTQASAPAYEAALQSAKQAAAGVGQLGSGMLRTRLGDLAMQRQQQMDYERSKLMTDAITGSISDQYQNIGIAQQQQGFQANQQAQDFQQALAAQQAALSSQLGVGQLGVAEKQAETARLGTTGNLALGQGQLGLGQQQLQQQGSQFGQTIDLQKRAQELDQLVATGQLTLAQKDQQLRELANQQQYGLASSQQGLAAELGRGQLGVQQGQLGLAQLQNQQQFGLSGQQLALEQKKQELDQMVRTGQLTLAQSAQQLDAWKAQQDVGLQQSAQAQQASQFTAAQQAQIKQFNDQLELQRADLTQKYGAAAADRIIEQQKVQNQQTQFQQAQAQQGQQFGLSLAEQQAQRLQQAGISQQEINLRAQQLQQEAALQGRSLSIQEAQNQAANQIAQQKIQQEGQQFGLSLAEQQAQRAQQGQQFGQQMSLEQRKAALDEKVRTGQLTLEQANQELERARLAQQGQQFGLTLAEQQAARAQQGQQFGQGQAQNQAQFNAQLELQRADLTQKYGAAAADRMIEQQKVANQAQQFGQSLGQQEKQFGLTLAEQQAQRRQQDLQFGQSDLTTQRGQTIAQQGQQQEYLARLAQILGVTDIGALKSLLGENFGLGGAPSGTPYGAPSGVPSSIPGYSTPVPPSAPPLPTEGAIFSPRIGTTMASRAEPQPAPINTMSGQWTPPTTSSTGSPLIPLAGGGTASKTATPTNQFAGWTSGQGGSFGGYDSAILPDIKQKYGKDMTFQQFDQSFLANALKMPPVPPLSPAEFQAMTQQDSGASTVKEKIALGLPVSDKELAFVRQARGAELQQNPASPTFGTFGIK